MVETTRDLAVRSWRGLAFLTAFACLPLHAATTIVSPGGSIQNAIDVASPGDTIQVSAATYTGQLVISKDLSLVGSGSATTTIQAPAAMSTDPTIGAPSIVVVNGGAAVSISGFTVQGPGAVCSVSFGVAVYGGATLTFTENHVTRIRDNPITGAQCGTAIRAGFGSQVGHLVVTNTLVDDYQKNGIYVFGAGSTGTISNTTVTGDGPETVIAQNGIFIAGGATATVNGNTVSGNDCDDTAAGCGPNAATDVQSGGIVMFNATVTMSNNDVNDNDAGILAFNSTTGVAPSTSSHDTLASNRYENIAVESATLSLQADTVGGTSNFALYALSSPGDVADSTVRVDCLSSITGPQQAVNDNGSVTTASIVLTPCPPSPPTIAKAFGAASIATKDSTTLTFTLTNPNAAAALTGVSFTDTLPAGLVVATPNQVAGACGGTVTAVAGAGSVALANGVLPASGSCAITLNVTANTSGAKNNTTGAVDSSEGGTGGSASATLTVVAAVPPTIATAFEPPIIALNHTTPLIFTLTNPNPGAALTGVGFTNELPDGLAVATPNGLASTCGGTVAAAAGGSNVALAGGGLPGGGSCTITVNVIGISIGHKQNVTGPVTSTEGGTGGTASARVLVLPSSLPIPTLSPWALAMLALLMAAAGAILFSRLH